MTDTTNQPDLVPSTYEIPKYRRDSKLKEHQEQYENTEKGKRRKVKYYSSEKGKQAKKRSQANYRANKVKGRREYFLGKLGPNPNLSLLLPIQAKVLRLYFGVYDEREPLMLRELSKACGLTLPMTKTNLAIACEAYGLEP